MVLLCFVAAVGRGVFGGGGGSCSGCRVGWHSAGKAFFFFFFLCGHKGPPSGENAVGLRFDCYFLEVWTLA